MRFIPYCTSYYMVEACKERARQLRETGKYRKVRVGAHITDRLDGKRYAKVYVSIDNKEEGAAG